MADGEPTGQLTRTFGANLLALRTAHGLSIRQLIAELPAEARPVPSTISKMEHGQKRVSLETVAMFAAFFGFANPWDLTAPLCDVCSGSPPAGMRCLTCGLDGR